MSLALPLFLQLAASFAPSIAPETVAAFAEAESHLEPFAIGDNDTGQSYRPASAAAAVALATSLLSQHHSLDLGIMQINSANLSRVGLTVATAFDPGQSIRAGAVILADAYQRCRRNGTVEEQVALRCAASVYNTGRETAGITNGYQARVWRVAAQLVPAIQIAGDAAPSAPPAPIAPQPAPAAAAAASGPVPVRVLSAPTRPPAWDVYASAVKSGAKQ